MKSEKLSKVVFLLACGIIHAGVFAGSFTEAFKAPNRDAQPWCYWWWQNGNATKESITADLESMKALGFGGTLLSDSRGYHDDEDHVFTPKPQNTVMDDEWRALVQHVIRECKRIGLQVAFNTATSGGKLCGPWQLGIDSPKRLMCRVYPKGAKHEKPDFPFWHDIASFDVKADAAELVKRGWFEAGDGTRTQHAGINNSTGAKKWYKEGVGEEYTVRFGWTTIPGHEYDADVLDPEAVRRFFNRFTGAIMDEAGADLVGADKTIAGIYSVSWEGVVPMWSPTFEADFRKFAGYDLRTKMTWLAGIAPEGADTEKFMVDCRRARNDMFRENFYGTLAAIAKERGVIMFSENGGPWRREPEVFLEADQLEFLALNDMPQGEFWVEEGVGMGKHWLNHSHEFVHMRGAVSAGHVYGKPRVSVEAFTHMTPHWSISPWTLKQAIDIVFADGGNHVVWHTFTHAFDSWGAPGYEYFAGTHINRNVTWHNEAKAFVGYLARCEAVLQAGEPVVDIPVKSGNRPYADWGRYRYQTPDGLSIPAGYNYDLVSDTAWAKSKVENGVRVFPSGMKYPAALPALPDLQGPWTFCHRATVDEDMYFLQGFAKGEAIFRVKAESVSLLDAVTGEITPLAITPIEDGRTMVTLDTTANGSAIVVLKRGEYKQELANQYNVTMNGMAAAKDDSVAVAGPWDVSFRYHRIDHTRHLPKPMKMAKLTDWTLSSDADLKYFSGHASYAASVELPADPKFTALALGALPTGVASVKVNGVDCGIVWCPPWEAKIPAGALKAGANRIEIEYTNNWQNRLIGDTFLPKAEQVTTSCLQLLPSRKKPNGKTLHRYSGYASTDPLQPSGLIGPVVLK